MLSRPSPGAVNSGMRTVVASKVQLEYGVLIFRMQAKPIASPDRECLVLLCDLQEQRLKFCELLRILDGEIAGLRVVLLRS